MGKMVILQSLWSRQMWAMPSHRHPNCIQQTIIAPCCDGEGIGNHNAHYQHVEIRHSLSAELIS